jgi:hypothetical protein
MLRIEQIPARRLELAWLDPASFVNPLKRSGRMVRKGLAPGDVAVPANDAVSHAMFKRLLGVQSRMYAPEDYSCSSFAGQSADMISSQRVTSMDPNSHRVARFNCRRV